MVHFGGECPQNPCLHTKWEFIIDVFQHMITVMVMKYPILFTYHFLNVIILHILLNHQPMTNKYIYIYQLATSHFGRCPKFQNFMSFTSFKSSHFWVHKTIQLLGSPWLAPLPLQVAARWALAPASPAPDGSRTARPRCDRLERWWYTYPSEKYDSHLG